MFKSQILGIHASALLARYFTGWLPHYVRMHVEAALRSGVLGGIFSASADTPRCHWQICMLGHFPSNCAALGARSRAAAADDGIQTAGQVVSASG
jgi:hypothetical protein